MRVAPSIELSSEEEAELTRLVRSKVTSVRLAQRARIVLLAAQGLRNKEIAEQLGVTRSQVGRWRDRYAELRLEGIKRELPRGAPPKKVDVRRLLELTTHSHPPAATNWSTRKLGAVLGVSASTVMRHWHAHGLRPHIARSSKVLQDPQFVERLEDIVGLYVASPEHALVLCCDEASPVQAVDRTQPGSPLKRGRAPTMAHDDKRHGTTLLAALKVLDEKVSGQRQQRQAYAKWLNFLRRIDREVPRDKTLHFIADNYATHNHPEVQRWLAEHPRLRMHFALTSTSWMNMIERFFRDLATERLRSGIFASVPELTLAINGHVTQHDARPKPFNWTRGGRDTLQGLSSK